MVAAECDDTRMVFAIEGDSLQRLASSRVITKRRKSLTMKKLLVAIFDLLNGILIVIRRNGDIATVDQLQARKEGIDLKWYVVSAVKSEAARARSDTSRPEPGTRAVRGAGVLDSVMSVFMPILRENDLTNGAPIKAMSNAVVLSFPRHCTHGNLANVVIPEKMESAVTVW